MAERLDRMMKLARERKEKSAAFIATQPQAIRCQRHADQVLAINLDETQKLSNADKGEFVAGYDRCPKCEADARIKDQNARLKSQGVPEILLDSTLDNWMPETQSEASNLVRLREFIRVRRGFLLMLGDLGTGKSHLAVAIMRHFQSAAFIKQNTLLRSLRATYRNANAPDPVEECQHVGLLVIDEMGLSGGGRDELPALHEVLDYRHGERLPTVLTGNLGIEAMKEIVGPRISDRLKESAFAILNFSGQSRRKEARARYFTHPDEQAS